MRGPLLLINLGYLCTHVTHNTNDTHLTKHPYHSQWHPYQPYHQSPASPPISCLLYYGPKYRASSLSLQIFVNLMVGQCNGPWNKTGCLLWIEAFQWLFDISWSSNKSCWSCFRMEMMTSEDGWNTHLCEVGCLMEKVKVTRHLLPDGITGPPPIFGPHVQGRNQMYGAYCSSPTAHKLV